jgi:hypothetical protein
MHCGFVERVHDFAVQGGAITSFVGCCMLNKHFRIYIVMERKGELI